MPTSHPVPVKTRTARVAVTSSLKSAGSFRRPALRTHHLLPFPRILRLSPLHRSSLLARHSMMLWIMMMLIPKTARPLVDDDSEEDEPREITEKENEEKMEKEL